MIKALVIIMACAAVGYGIYTTNILGVKDFVDPLVSGVASQVGENPLAVAAGVIPTVTAVGGLAWKAVSSIKDRAKDEVNQIAVNANSQVQDYQTQAAQLSAEKDLLQQKVAELESMPNDALEIQKTLAIREKEITRLTTSNQTLMDALQRDKLDAGEKIIKTVVA